MIHAKYQHIVFAIFMAAMMSCLMSLVISVFNVGLVENIVHIWFKAWGFAFIIAFPAVVVVTPVVRKMVSLVIDNKA